MRLYYEDTFWMLHTNTGCVKMTNLTVMDQIQGLDQAGPDTKGPNLEAYARPDNDGPP